MPLIKPLDHRDMRVAREIHAVLKLAHAQEAQRLGIERELGHQPTQPLTLQDIQASDEFYLGAYLGAALAGATSVGPDDEPHQLSITSLVVHPQFQRQGVGRSLVCAALGRGEGITFAVSTAAANAPALALYRGLGFVPYRHGSLGPGKLAMLKLRRAGTQALGPQ